ncbi:MAG: bifunctional adenosylcobinamide kinase/adenosylcobinamide-phosphate guanylyltransferase [Dissulfurispiraceae bacterium]|nr:bifunctional adenosylcobinamide kinase/adenosylcobinamide-phosphate guanylyltransferase [Dissulfurispiraceae bacterium]
MSKTTGIMLYIGGVRSGKSSAALAAASALPGKKAYIATAEAFDDEMSERIKKHREERGPDWESFEAPLDIAGILKRLDREYNVIVIDCLTLWLSNLIMSGKVVAAETEQFIKSLKDARVKTAVFIVTNEVGQGIVPDNPLARQFRDQAGFLNQKTAAVSDEVFLVTAGIPVKIK